jgi:hypothetical protein
MKETQRRAQCDLEIRLGEDSPAHKPDAIYAKHARAPKDDPSGNWDGVWTLASK